MAMNLLQHAGRRLLDEGGDDDELEEELEVTSGQLSSCLLLIMSILIFPCVHYHSSSMSFIQHHHHFDLHRFFIILILVIDINDRFLCSILRIFIVYIHAIEVGDNAGREYEEGSTEMWRGDTHVAYVFRRPHSRGHAAE